MSRQRGTVGACSSCGALGHNGTHSGCSPSYLAAQRVLNGECTLVQAAERFGISRQSINERIRKSGLRVARSR